MSGKSYSKGVKKFVVFGIALAVVLSVILVALIIIDNSEGVYEIIRKSVTVEAGTETLNVDSFIISDDGSHDISLVTDLKTLDLRVPGCYTVELKCDGELVKSDVNVVDTTVPVASPVESIAFKGIDISAETLVKDIVDCSPVTVSLKNKDFLSAVGKYDVTVILTDSFSNFTELKVPVNVVEDVSAPTISGVGTLYAEVGGTINYRKGVTVTDDYDLSPKLTVNSENVDISKEGIYEVVYTAVDVSENKTVMKANVVVRNVDTSDTESIDKAVEMAEDIIGQIITDDMNVKDKVTAIYRWARYNLIYAGSSDKSDYRIAAYKTLSSYSGDCYGYFAVTKLMFELLDIPNIDVIKVKNSEADSRHFWSLVSVDGGSTYYHFDATPRKGDGDDFCLVTDAFLDAYSDAHNKCHNRDKSLYPATPTEDVQ